LADQLNEFIGIDAYSVYKQRYTALTVNSIVADSKYMGFTVPFSLSSWATE
jgi:hypothetical protein